MKFTGCHTQVHNFKIANRSLRKLPAIDQIALWKDGESIFPLRYLIGRVRNSQPPADTHKSKQNSLALAQGTARFRRISDICQIPSVHTGKPGGTLHTLQTERRHRAGRGRAKRARAPVFFLYPPERTRMCTLENSLTFSGMRNCNFLRCRDAQRTPRPPHGRSCHHKDEADRRTRNGISGP